MTRLSPIEAHRRWAPLYDATVNPLLALESRVARTMLTGLNPKLVIDVGCGTGRGLLKFATQGTRVAGIDACQEMLAEAARQPSLRKRLALADAERLPIATECADLVTCSFAASYFHDFEAALVEITRITTRLGYVATSDMHPDAVAAGWTRSFRIGADSFEIEHRCYSLRDWKLAAWRAGLRMLSSWSACFGEPELPLFQSAGREDQWETARHIPAVWFALWTKL